MEEDFKFNSIGLPIPILNCTLKKWSATNNILAIKKVPIKAYNTESYDVRTNSKPITKYLL